MKEAIRGREAQLGVFICGGKGKTSKRTPEEIENWGQRLSMPEPRTRNLIYNSKMSAKVDSALVQDGFQIYHHSFMFSRNGVWAVVQQGMNKDKLSARRYHWYSEKVEDLVCEPHAGISSELTLSRALDLTARGSTKTREVSTELVGGGYATLMKDINLLRKYSSPLSQVARLETQRGQLTLLNLENREFKYHPVVEESFSSNRYLDKILAKVVYAKPENYERLVAMEGVGPKTLRALALVGEVIYGAKPSYEDPARYSFAHGGKDGTPYPVDRQTYDSTIRVLGEAVRRTKLTSTEKEGALGRLYNSVE